MTAYTHFDSWYVGGAGFWPSTVLIIGVALCNGLVVHVCTALYLLCLYVLVRAVATARTPPTEIVTVLILQKAKNVTVIDN